MELVQSQLIQIYLDLFLIMNMNYVLWSHIARADAASGAKQQSSVGSQWQKWTPLVQSGQEAAAEVTLR